MKSVTLNLRLDPYSNRVLEVVKAAYGLRNKSEAANRVFHETGAEIIEPVLNEEFAAKVLKDTEEWEKKYKFKRKMTLEELDRL